MATVHQDLKNEADVPNSKVFDFPELKESDIKKADARTGKTVAKTLVSKDKPKGKSMGKVQDASNTSTTPKLLINKFATVPEKDTAFDEHYNFDTQILPSILNRKEYTSKNKHLPKAMYKEDLDNALFLAVGRGDLNATRALLDRGANIEAHNTIGDTPLIHAALSGQAGSMRVLLARGAKADATNRQGLTALNLAAQRGRVDMVDALFEMGAKGGRKYTDKDTANRSGLSRGYLSVLSAFQTGENPDIAKRASRNRALEALASAGQAPKVLVTSGPGESAEIRDPRNSAAPVIEPGTSPSFDDVERGLLYQEYIKKTGSAPNTGALSLTTQPTTIIPLKETKLVADAPPAPAFAPSTANAIVPNAPNTTPPMSVIPNAIPGTTTSPMQIPGANLPVLQNNNPAPASIPAMSRDQRSILPPPAQNNAEPNLAPFGRSDVTPGSPLPHPNEAEPMGTAVTGTTTGVTTTAPTPASAASGGPPQSIIPTTVDKQFNPTGDGPPIAAESLLPPLPSINSAPTAP